MERRASHCGPELPPSPARPTGSTSSRSRLDGVLVGGVALALTAGEHPSVSIRVLETTLPDDATEHWLAVIGAIERQAQSVGARTIVTAVPARLASVFQQAGFGATMTGVGTADRPRLRPPHPRDGPGGSAAHGRRGAPALRAGGPRVRERRHGPGRRPHRSARRLGHGRAAAGQHWPTTRRTTRSCSSSPTTGTAVGPCVVHARRARRRPRDGHQHHRPRSRAPRAGPDPARAVRAGDLRPRARPARRQRTGLRPAHPAARQPGGLRRRRRRGPPAQGPSSPLAADLSAIPWLRHPSR